ncbi:hypothetical protein A9Q89_07485 [Gammaproteobacteria bacterium 53_120_T64]|nr:hypothetical protein A9Q89_07485 [Gammaproteobacteria bacterium 53_120_T64]
MFLLLAAELLLSSDVVRAENKVLTSSKLTAPRPSIAAAAIGNKISGDKVLVVYFSRSGNTKLLAREISRYYQSALLPIKAEDYPVGIAGLFNAVVDSQDKFARIKPQKVDLSGYDIVFIGAPIWFGSPAPPAWQFVANNKLSDKGVVLFSTFNSGFKQQFIDDYKAAVELRGGRYIDHLYIRRGRLLGQLNADDFLLKARDELDCLVLNAL